MTNKNERLLELLADKALLEVSQDEKTELAQLEQSNPDFEGDVSFENAAAAFNIASVDDSESLPEGLMNKLSADAEEFFGAAVENTDSEEDLIPSTVREVVFEQKSTFSQLLGWLVAGAACVALAASLWFGDFNSQRADQINPPPPPPTIDQKRESLLASGTDIDRSTWESPDKTMELEGDVVWNEAKQEGYIKLKGLPVNDRSKETYQLWIFDEGQGDKTPVDGGVFDISKDGEVIIPIDPRISVRGAKMFAVTVEKPGGVVVSDREKIVALAKLS